MLPAPKRRSVMQLQLDRIADKNNAIGTSFSNLCLCTFFEAPPSTWANGPLLPAPPPCSPLNSPLLFFFARSTMCSLRQTTITACLSLLYASDTAFAIEFIPVGPGSCLDIHGLRPQRHYKMGGVSASDCRQVCEASPHCTAYSHRTTDGYCSVFGTGSCMPCQA